MLYVDYVFEINEDGLCFIDKHKDEMLTLERTGLQEGDTLEVRLDDLNRICLVRKHVKGNEGNFYR